MYIFFEKITIFYKKITIFLLIFDKFTKKTPALFGAVYFFIKKNTTMITKKNIHFFFVSSNFFDFFLNKFPIFYQCSREK